MGCALGRGAPRRRRRARSAITRSPTIGYQEYSRRLAVEYGDPLPPGVVLVSATAHYSWEKIVRALGIGSNQLVHVPVDTRFRMDPDALWEQVVDARGPPAGDLACVSVCGSTEESAVDRLDQVLEVRGPRRAGAGSDLSSPLGRLLRRLRGGRDPVRGRRPA